MKDEAITLNHGAGGRQMHQFINNVILKELSNGILERLDDSAVIKNSKHGRLAMTTDSYVVSPLFFPGGDIGRLAVSGTINDLTTSGAIPLGLSLAFILEDGVKLEVLERIVHSIAIAAKEANVKIITGDTKVVEQGKGDKIFINTCAIGSIPDHINLSSYNATDGDIVMITGAIGNHEITLMKERELFDFDTTVTSDAAPLNIQVQSILENFPKLNVVKDPTRGGVASALNEIVDHSNCSIILQEQALPIDPEVANISELLGLDPLYMANEGKFIIIGPAEMHEHVREFFPDAVTIGKVKKDKKAVLLLETKFGGLRRVGMLETTQLPRIC